MMRIVFIVLFSIIIFFSCTSQVKVLKPEGETVSLRLNNNPKYDGELFAVNDTSLFFGYRAMLFEVPLSNIDNVYVHGYSLKSIKVLTMLPALFFYAIGIINQEPSGKWYWITAEALTILSIFIGDPKVKFSHPINKKELDKLRLYCRYPQRLTHEKWRQLLQYYKQEQFLDLTQLEK